jgi:TonB family protein
LTNTVVRLLVDADGWTRSPVLLKRSGYEAADKLALKFAKGARFESLAETGPRSIGKPPAPLTWGEMVFEWHTFAPK